MTSIACLHSTSLCCDAAVRHADGAWGGGVFCGPLGGKLLLIVSVFPIGLPSYERETHANMSKILHSGAKCTKTDPCPSFADRREFLQHGRLVCSLALSDSVRQSKALFSTLLWFYYKTADDQMRTKRPTREVRRPTELRPIHFPLKKDRKNKGREGDGSRK